MPKVYDKEDTKQDFDDIVSQNFSEAEQERLNQEMGGAQSSDNYTSANSRKDDPRYNSYFNRLNETSSKEKSALKDKAGGLTGEKGTRSAKGMGDEKLGKRAIKMAGSKLVSKRRKYAIAGGIVGSLVGGVMSFIIGVLPFELPYIANVLNAEIGGVSGNILVTRSGKLYSRMFFFDPDTNQFDGFKERGIFKTLTFSNYRSQRLFDDFRTRGFDATPQLDRNGLPTGRFERITMPGRIGPGYDGPLELTNERTFRDAWNNRQAIKKTMTEQFPERGWFYRSAQARKVYNRYNVGKLRGQWWSNRLADGIDNAKLRMKAKIRSALFGPESGVRPPNVPDSTSSEDTTDGEGNSTRTQTEVDGTGFGEEAADRQNLADFENVGQDGRLVDGETISDITNGTDDAAARAARNILSVGTLARVVNVLGGTDTLCQVKRLFITVEKGARYLRAIALLRYTSLFLSMADVALTGEVDSNDISAFTSFLHDVNPQTGNDFYGSGGWQYARRAPGAKVNDVFTNSYGVGGGWTGRLQGIRQSGILPGETTCEIVTNPFVQIGGVGAGLIATGFSFGGYAAVKIGGQIIIEIVKAIAEAILVPMLIDMAAGTVITMDEFGDEMAAALISGNGVMLAAQGSNFGLIPVTTRVLSVHEAEAENERRSDLANMSLYERYLSPQNHRSLVASTMMSIPRSTKAVTNTFANVITSPFNYLFGSLKNMPFSNAYAAIEYSNQCTDPDITDNDIAADPFCNPIFAENVQTLSLDPFENFTALMESGNIDDEGFPLEEGDEDINGNILTEDSDYYTHITNCTGKIDIIHDYDSEFGADFTNRCMGTDDTSTTDVNGVEREFTEEEMIARNNTVYTFDDLYALDSTPTEESFEPGKAYAHHTEEHDLALAEFAPSNTERYRAAVLDTALLLSIEEDLTAEFFQGGNLESAPAFEAGYSPGDYLGYGYPDEEELEEKPLIEEPKDRYVASNNQPTENSINVCKESGTSFNYSEVCAETFKVDVNTFRDLPDIAMKIKSSVASGRFVISKNYA